MKETSQNQDYGWLEMNCFMTLEQREKSFMNDEHGRTWKNGHGLCKAENQGNLQHDS
jgi:hypothetical protein